MNATATDHKKRYRQLLRRAEAEALCAEFGIGFHTFKRWCQGSPVEGKEFRRKLPGFSEYRYVRDTILEACGNVQQS